MQNKYWITLINSVLQKYCSDIYSMLGMLYRNNQKKDDRGNLVILILCDVTNGLFHNVFSFFDFVVIKPLCQLCVGFSFDVF